MSHWTVAVRPSGYLRYLGCAQGRPPSNVNRLRINYRTQPYLTYGKVVSACISPCVCWVCPFELRCQSDSEITSKSQSLVHHAFLSRQDSECIRLLHHSRLCDRRLCSFVRAPIPSSTLSHHSVTECASVSINVQTVIE